MLCDYLLVAFYRYRDGVSFCDPVSDTPEMITNPPVHSCVPISFDSDRVLCQILEKSREVAEREIRCPFKEGCLSPEIRADEMKVISCEIAFCMKSSGDCVANKDGEPVQLVERKPLSVIAIRVFTPQDAGKIWSGVDLCRPINFDSEFDLTVLHDLENAFIGKWIRETEKRVEQYLAMPKVVPAPVTVLPESERQEIAEEPEKQELEFNAECQKFRNTIAEILRLFFPDEPAERIVERTNKIAICEFNIANYNHAGNRPVFDPNDIHYRNIAVFVHCYFFPSESRTAARKAVNALHVDMYKLTNSKNITSPAIHSVIDVFGNFIKKDVRIPSKKTSKKKKDPSPKSEKGQEKLKTDEKID